MKKVKSIQFAFGLAALLSIALILSKYLESPGGSSDCLTFELAYIFQILGLVISTSLSYLIYKKEKSCKNIHLYVPLLFLTSFLLLFLGYQFGYLEIYEDMYRAAGKTYSQCDVFPLKILLKDF